MSSINQCLASLARLRLAIAAPSRPILQPTPIPRFLAPAAITQQMRHATGSSKGKKDTKKKKKQHKSFKVTKLDKVQQFTLCDAIRYARAVEVGQNPVSVKYELAIKLRTLKSGPVIKSRISLPHSVRSDRRIGVICAEDSTLAKNAKAAGAVAVGEDSLFELIRSGKVDFTSIICHQGSLDKLQKANLGRILGPRGLMPNVRQGTITSDVMKLIREMSGSDNYREKDGVVRIAIGQLTFTPEMLATNVKAFVSKVKQDITDLGEQVTKDVHEVVMSTTHGPGFSLNGAFKPTHPAVTTSMLHGPH